MKARPGNGRRSRDPALDQPKGAVPTGEVVTTGYGKTSNAGFPNERREVFLDVTPRWTREGSYQFVKPITPGMNCTRKSGQTAGACGTG
ncbi:hypothetical protein [Amycolatopsis albispora]|uniref:hypothetical protein n=1 Tax=Amycolatopsis albispora TaxID=1804986 RepID=UPI0013B3E7BF|nr:hypothetical protein [Amycolatopsis albispora]